MDCKKVQKELIFYLESPADYQQQPYFVEHLVKCEKCSHYLNRMKLDFLAIQNMKIESSEKAFEDKVIFKIEHPVNHTYKINRLMFRMLAASIILIATISGGWFIGNISSNKIQESQNFANTINTQSENDNESYADNTFNLLENNSNE